MNKFRNIYALLSLWILNAALFTFLFFCFIVIYENVKESLTILFVKKYVCFKHFNIF